MNDMVTTTTDLAVLKTLTPAVLFQPGKVDEILSGIETEARKLEADISTTQGRDAIRSMAYKVARSKTALDKMGKDLTEEWRTRTSAVNAERRAIVARLDALADEVRRPLTDYEETEKARVAEHESLLAAISETPGYGEAETSAELELRLKYLTNYPPRDWQEFTARARVALTSEIDRTDGLLAKARKREADAAELERLRAEEEKRQQVAAALAQQAREERIAAEAAEAARVAAEERAAREAREAEEKAKAALRAEQEAAAERERLAAKELARVEAERLAGVERERRRAEKREAERVEIHKFALQSIRAMIADACSPFNGSNMIRHIAGVMDKMPEITRDFQEFAEEAETLIAEGREKIKARLTEVVAHEEEASKRREAEAEAKAERDRLSAIEAERQRVAKEAAAQKAEDDRRAADKAHRGKINREARDAIEKAMDAVEGSGSDMPTIRARAVVEAIAKGLIPHVSIRY